MTKIIGIAAHVGIGQTALVKDDGLSARLDAITFPKWRSESIKAHGNAIVPQLALQIFETIEHYEMLY